MRVCSIASGSSGNCIYVGEKGHHILIDAGISRKRIVEGLKELDVAPEELDAILITHEHSDHIKGLEMMEKKYQVPIYATGGTLDAIRQKDKNHVIPMERLFQVRADRPISLGGMEITPFRISHDAAEPVCYTVESDGHKVSMATDLGVYDDYTISYLEGSEVLLLEANHDISMLETGHYPYPLKCRILSEYGHLSNEASGSLLCKLLHDRLQHIFLAHLSKENNYPELAYETVKCQLWQEMGMQELPFGLSVAKRDAISESVIV